MFDQSTLRRRILSALGAGLSVTAFDVVACGGSDADALAVSCANGAADIQCWAPHETHFSAPNLPPGTPVSNPAPIFDQNGCQIAEQVADGCCNPPSAGPEFKDAKCCYAFCTGACCGRPFMVGGAPRVAPFALRDDWAACDVDDRIAGGLGSHIRDRIAGEWLRDARMEHASIASFARFTLDLLAFGAPPELVRDAQRAALDEVRHARTCFAVASVYGGVPCGPGALGLDGARCSASLAEAAVAAFCEGCVGETTAALLAGERARASGSPALRRIYERIAQDEATHAELAFRFVAWAIERGGSAVLDGIAEAASALVTSPSASPCPPSGEILRAHGRLSDGEVRSVERLAVSQVIAPCARALLATSPSRLRARGAGTMLLGRT